MEGIDCALKAVLLHRSLFSECNTVLIDWWWCQGLAPTLYPIFQKGNRRAIPLEVASFIYFGHSYMKPHNSKD